MTISSTGIVETALKIQNKRRNIQAGHNDIRDEIWKRRDGKCYAVNIYSVHYSVEAFYH